MVTKLGRLDLCIDVKNAKTSFEFYKKLGMKLVEGNPNEGWSVMESGNLRLGLYQDMSNYGKGGGATVSLNFRGGDVENITKDIEALGYKFSKPFKAGKDGGGSSTVTDPNEVPVFFDTAPSEIGLLDKVTLDYAKTSSLGSCDVCFDTKKIAKTAKFYREIGFEDVEGDEKEGWVILGHANARIALFQGESNNLTINFRGANIIKLTDHLKNQGFKFETEYVVEDDGSKSSSLRDPDGYFIYFNTHPNELN
ncbi:MAG: VOC family protein [Candidatus Heimdallarchaeota archaeon]|nr:VOC family protein [Candidatus Heimdallarchaeota archaeon]